MRTTKSLTINDGMICGIVRGYIGESEVGRVGFLYNPKTQTLSLGAGETIGGAEFYTHSDYRGQGIATTLGRITLEYALETITLPVKTINLRTNSENKRMQKVANKLGFQISGFSHPDMIYQLSRINNGPGGI